MNEGPHEEIVHCSSCGENKVRLNMFLPFALSVWQHVKRCERKFYAPATAKLIQTFRRKTPRRSIPVVSLTGSFLALPHAKTPTNIPDQKAREREGLGPSASANAKHGLGCSGRGFRIYQH